MTEPIIINENKCDYFQSYREENNWDIPIDTDWCVENDCKCSDVPFNKCLVKAIEYCKIKDKQLKRKEQECKKYKKYKKCIKEIRDELEYSLHCEAEECGCDDDSECLKCTINLILKKINEVVNGWD